MDYIIKNENLVLRPLDKDLLGQYLNWLNDYKINRFLGPIRGAVFTEDKIQEWYEEMKEGNDKRILTIYHLGEEQ